jgi:hypothetical protein
MQSIWWNHWHDDDDDTEKSNGMVKAIVSDIVHGRTMNKLIILDTDSSTETSKRLRSLMEEVSVKCLLLPTTQDQ